MVFSQCVRAYKINVKFVKNVGAKVMSIGFPVSEVEKGRLNLEYISEKIGSSGFEVSGSGVVFILDNIEVKTNYNTWVETLKKEMAVDVIKESESPYMTIDVLNSIADMIKDLNLANSTPMQGLNFIQQHSRPK